MVYQPKTGARCGCRPGVARDNCTNCEGTGQVIDFAAIRARRLSSVIDDRNHGDDEREPETRDDWEKE